MAKHKDLPGQTSLFDAIAPPRFVVHDNGDRWRVQVCDTTRPHATLPGASVARTTRAVAELLCDLLNNNQNRASEALAKDFA